MTRSEILAAADQCISVDRDATYGSAADNLNRIAEMWSAYLGHQLSAADVCWLMVLLKAGRKSSGKPHIDNAIDAAGYAALAGELE
jgi:hypothetical protein